MNTIFNISKNIIKSKFSLIVILMMTSILLILFNSNNIFAFYLILQAKDKSIIRKTSTSIPGITSS